MAGISGWMFRHPATTDAYLTLIASQETVAGAQAGLDRADVLVRFVRESSSLRVGLGQRRAFDTYFRIQRLLCCGQ